MRVLLLHLIDLLIEGWEGRYHGQQRGNRRHREPTGRHECGHSAEIGGGDRDASLRGGTERNHANPPDTLLHDDPHQGEGEPVELMRRIGHRHRLREHGGAIDGGII